MKTARANSASTTNANAINANSGDSAMSTKSISQLSKGSITAMKGEALTALYTRVLGTSPKANTPAPILRSRIIAELEKRAAEGTLGELDEQVIAIEPATPAVIHPVSEDEAMRAASDAVKRGADPAACSKLVALFEDATIDSIAFHKGLETEIAAAAEQPAEQPAEAPVEAPVEQAAEQPVEQAAEAPQDAPQAPADAEAQPEGQPALDDAPQGQPEDPAEQPAEPAQATSKDATDLLLDRAREMDDATRDAFLIALPKKDLHLAVERLTGQKTSGRLAPATAVARIKEALGTKKASEVTPPVAVEQPATTEAPIAPAQPERDPRLPAVGTILRRVDRHGTVKAECTVEADGFTFAGEKFKTLSGAAMAAAKSLGLTSTTQNGFTFWQLDTAPSRSRSAHKPLDLEALGKVWNRYLERASEMLKDASPDEAKTLREQLLAHAEAIFDLAQPPKAEVAEPAPVDAPEAASTTDGGSADEVA